MIDSDVRMSGKPLRVLGLAVPLALLALASLDLVVRGAHGIGVAATNLPPPLNSSGVRIVDLVHPTAPEGRVYQVTVVRDPAHEANALGGAHVQLQLASRGKTRLLLIERGTGDASRLRGLLSVLRGRATLQVVDDRAWVDLGPLPGGGAPLRVQVLGLLPGSFSFAELDRQQGPTIGRIAIDLADPPRPVVTTIPRYRVARDAPIAAGEMLARVGFFLGSNRLVLACGLLAVATLVAGWTAVTGAHVRTGVLLLVSSVTLMHAVLLPPLQGADETSQVGTIEWLVSDPSPARAWRFPESIALVSRALEQDRVQFHPREPLPIGDAGSRTRLRNVLRDPLARESTQAGTPPPAADLQVVAWRAPLFYAVYQALDGAFLDLPVGDRIFAYRLVATLLGLAPFAAGLALLRWARLPEEIAIAYGFAFLVPYVVATSATCSNYAPAIGLGFLIAAGIVTAILADAARARWSGGGVALAAAWIGVPVWADFIGLAAVATLVSATALVLAAIASARPSTHDAQDGRRRRTGWRHLYATALLIAAAMLVAWWNFPGLDERLASVAEAGRDRQLLSLRAALVAGPLLLALLLAGVSRRLGAAPLERHRRAAATASAALAMTFIVMFAITPYAEVPYENVFLALPDLVRAHLASFWATSFSFDQDRLGWKFLFGAFGWHDTFFPEAVYALARWAFVAFLIALPMLAIDFAHRRPAAAGLLIVASGTGVSLSAVSLLVRHAMSVHPHGRFILPWLPLVIVPALALLATSQRRLALVVALRLAVAVNVWTTIAVIGARYAIAS